VARRSGFNPRSRSRSSGIAKGWDSGPGGSALTTLTASGSALLGSGVSAVSSELTVIRTRGRFHSFMLGAGVSDGDGYFGAIGIGKCTLAAFTAGIASVPTPITEIGWDGWLWHSIFGVHNPDLTFGGSPATVHDEAIDSKAMRKFDTLEVLYAAVEVVEIGTATLNIFFDTRMLVQDSGR